MPDYDDDLNVLTRTKPKIEVPKMWGIVFHNDDFTPMEFVVMVLVTVLKIDLDEASRIMLTVHRQGAAKVGRYTRDVAETKCDEIAAMAKKAEVPLRVHAEEA